MHSPSDYVVVAPREKVTSQLLQQPDWAAIIDREDEQEPPPGADHLTNFNTTLANNNNNLFD